MKRKLKLGLLVLLLLSAGLLAAGSILLKPYRRNCHQSVRDVPRHRVALLLGTGKWIRRTGEENRLYRYRIDAAAELWLAGKADYILASGDNSRKDYDEPSQMTIDLVDRGVPFDAIYRDYAGFRTLDSVVRAKQIFGLQDMTIVSQPFHNERALLLAESMGIRAVGFNARDVEANADGSTPLREKFARAAALLDVWILKTRPRLLGPRVEIGKDPAP